MSHVGPSIKSGPSLCAIHPPIEGLLPRTGIEPTPFRNYAFGSQMHLQARNFIKKRLQHKCFLVNIAKFLSTPILKNICERLLLYTSL